MSEIPRIIHRSLRSILRDAIWDGRKVVLLYGARQVGKTTLIEDLLKEYPGRVLSLSADSGPVEDVFSSRDLRQLDLMTSGYDLVFLDEAQRIPEVGLSLKLLHDQRPDRVLVVTGSSILEIASRTRESLTGRTRSFVLFPVSSGELGQSMNPYKLNEYVEELLRFGAYPEVFSYSGADEKMRYLEELCSGYLYKDILELLQLRHSQKLRDLLKLLSFQVGSQVSLSEIGSQLGMTKETVSHYIDLLEQSFVLFRLGGFSRNLRKEMSKMDKIYFYDLGVRNSIIGNHKPLKDRNDIGQLWKNFLIMERMKAQRNAGMRVSMWYWRTHTGAELDLIEESEGQLRGYEFKWSKSRVKAPESWSKTYPEATWQCVTKDNYLDFVLCKI